MSSPLHKLALGTAQFGMDYGIKNTTGAVSHEEIEKILGYASDKGVELIDTAHLYGESENKLGRFDLDKFKVVSKYPGNEGVEDYLEQSLKRLNTSSLYAYLVHDFETFKINAEYYSDLIKIKEQGHIEKIGYSLYHPDQLAEIIERKFMADIVQVPYNILDRRFEKYFPVCREHNIEVHARSAFLQGLLLMDPATLTEKLKDFNLPLSRLRKLVRDSNISLNQACIWFVVNNPDIRYIVLGIDNFNQFSNNVSILENPIDITILDEISNQVIMENEMLLNPSNWK